MTVHHVSKNHVFQPICVSFDLHALVLFASVFYVSPLHFACLVLSLVVSEFICHCVCYRKNVFIIRAWLCRLQRKTCMNTYIASHEISLSLSIDVYFIYIYRERLYIYTYICSRAPRNSTFPILFGSCGKAKLLHLTHLQTCPTI